MPIKRITEKTSREIGDILDEYYLDDDIYYEDMIDNLNHLFAKIYGYQKTLSRKRVQKSWLRETKPKTKRKLSAWNKFIKANSNKKKFQYANGKLKLKKMGIAYRKKRR